MASPRTFECPVCGGKVPVKAKACHHCGACEKTGWNEDATAADGLDLPEEDFDYEKFVQEEFKAAPRKSRGVKIVWWITALILLLVTTGLTIYNMLFN